MPFYNPRPKIESVVLKIDNHEIAGIRYRDPNHTQAIPLLCIHGWLDNANSFSPLLPYLPHFDIVSLDLPGHGYSKPLPQGYNFHELYYRIRRCLDALQWDSCHLVGHSLGGCIAPLLAVADPDCIKSLVMIEASGPLTEPVEKLPARLQRALSDRLDVTRYRSRRFNAKQDAVNARLKAAHMLPSSARLIIDRQVRQIDDHYEWAFDPTWRAASPQYFTEDQVKTILSAVACPCLTVIADEGYLAQRPETEDRLNCLKHRTTITLPGFHHLHMDTPEPVATAINRFYEVPGQ